MLMYKTTSQRREQAEEEVFYLRQEVDRLVHLLRSIGIPEEIIAVLYLCIVFYVSI